jgi:metallo-beta-lactamase class B
MKKNINPTLLILLIALFSFPVHSEEAPKPVELTQVTDSIWVHTSYQVYNGVPTPSNGIVAITKKGLVLVDTCWDPEATAALLKMAQTKFKQKFVLAIITHGAHADRIGGIEALLKAKIPVVGTQLVAQEAIEAGFPDPSTKLHDVTTDLEVGGVKIQTYYPGPGHSQDNLTVWFPGSKTLFGGCFIKSLDSANLGNTADGDLQAWPNSLKNLLQKYPDAAIVIPGHGKWGDISLIYHTLKLFK